MNVSFFHFMRDLLGSGYRVTRETLRVFSDALDKGPNSRIPPCADSISPEWLTSVMQVHAPGVRVKSVEPVSEHFGTTTHVRISVTYNRGGEEAGLPKLFFSETQVTGSGNQDFREPDESAPGRDKIL
jgi:hypothetical protein